MESAAERLAATPELMHQVFAQLDMQTLLISIQRVCKAWRDIVKASHSLQRALFFEPVAALDNSNIMNKRVINPLLQEIFTPFFPGPGEPSDRSAQVRMKNEPFAFMDKPARGIGSEKTRPVTKISGAACRDAFLRKEASWRKMQIQQPTVPRLGYVEIRGPGERSFYTDTLEPALAASGVTMGMLYDVVYRFLGQKADRSGFNVHWRTAAAESGAKPWYYSMTPDGIVSKFPDSVGVAVVRDASPIRKDQGDDSVRDLRVLDGKYRPKGMQLYNPSRQYSGGEDWFG